MKNKADYSQYQCPYTHLGKDCGHELKGPEGYENTYGVWCNCGFRGPVFYLDPDELNLVKKENKEHIDCVLWDADETCEHNIISAPGGGVKCTKCTGWFCY